MGFHVARELADKDLDVSIPNSRTERRREWRGACGSY
jgi:hypothetical protein